MRDSGLAAPSLEIEITESTLMADPEHAIKVLGELHGMGLQITVDDFGTGYSSVSYLKRLPLDRIKIDQSFVLDIPADADDVVIVQTILAMAKQLKICVVAGGDPRAMPVPARAALRGSAGLSLQSSSPRRGLRGAVSEHAAVRGREPVNPRASGTHSVTHSQRYASASRLAM
ncbi:MAG: EAL domain-containing protein [Gammaproteobacteria bacterium]